MSSATSFNQISPSEFFYRNRDLAGFSNPTRSLYTAVREFVENSLDACDRNGILPTIHLSIKAADPKEQDPRHYILTVTDNGPGIPSDHVPLAFGTVLYGSKFVLQQTRGMFGLGATMAILYGQITTNRSVHVKSSTDGKVRDEYEMLLDIQKNKPVVLKHTTSPARATGLSVKISLEGDYNKAGAKIRDYMYKTALITPYATMTFDDPKGQKFSYSRIMKSMPAPPTTILPHPYGVDVETIRRITVESMSEIPKMDEKMINKVRSELKIKEKKITRKSILKAAPRMWKGLTRNTRTVVTLVSFLDVEPDRLERLRIDDINIARNELAYTDQVTSKSTVVALDPESTYYRQLERMVQGDTLNTLLTKRFQRIGAKTAEKFATYAGFTPETRLGNMSNTDIVKLSDSLQKFTDFKPPDPTCLAPLGMEPFERGIRRSLEPDFCVTVQRPAAAYSGFPFVIELGIAYGGGVPSDGLKVYRFANRIPLLYDEGSDVVLKVIGDVDWPRYKIKGDPPLVIVSHICSTRIPYKTVGKENVADRIEIEREIRLALQHLLRKMSAYMSKKGQAESARKRANMYQKYLPLIAQFCTELAGKKKEPAYKAILKEQESHIIPETVAPKTSDSEKQSNLKDHE